MVEVGQIRHCLLCGYHCEWTSHQILSKNVLHQLNAVYLEILLFVWNNFVQSNHLHKVFYLSSCGKNFLWLILYLYTIMKTFWKWNFLISTCCMNCVHPSTKVWNKSVVIMLISKCTMSCIISLVVLPKKANLSFGYHMSLPKSSNLLP